MRIVHSGGDGHQAELAVHANAGGGADMGGDVGQQGEMTRSLDGNGHHSLVFGTGAGPSSRVNLRSFRDKATQLHRILIVNLFRLLGTEDADFASRYVLSTGANPTLLLICLCSHYSYLSLTQFIV